MEIAPTPSEQQRFYDLHVMSSYLLQLKRRAEQVREEVEASEGTVGAGPGSPLRLLLNEIEGAFEAAERRLDTFVSQHPDKAFQVFEPEAIEAAFDDDVRPLFTGEGDDQGE